MRAFASAAPSWDLRSVSIAAGLLGWEEPRSPLRAAMARGAATGPLTPKEASFAGRCGAESFAAAGRACGWVLIIVASCGKRSGLMAKHPARDFGEIPLASWENEELCASGHKANAALRSRASLDAPAMDASAAPAWGWEPVLARMAAAMARAAWHWPAWILREISRAMLFIDSPLGVAIAFHAHGARG